MSQDPLTGQDPDTRRAIIAGLLPVTDDMVQAVIDGLAEEEG